MHLIKNPDHYPEALSPGASKPVRAKAPRPAGAADAPTAAPGAMLAEELAKVDPRDQPDFVIKRLTLLYPRNFSASNLDELRHRLATGQLPAFDFLNEALARLARMDGQGFVQDVRAALSPGGR